MPIFIIFSLLAIYETLLYAHLYSMHYPNSYRVLWGGAEKELVEATTALSKNYDMIVINENYLPNQKIYFLFYNDHLKPLFVTNNWYKPKELESKRILYIRYPYQNDTDNTHMKLIKEIKLDVPTHDTVVRLWNY